MRVMGSDFDAVRQKSVIIFYGLKVRHKTQDF